MKNINYDDILADFGRRRLIHMDEAAARKSEIYDKFPEIKAIDERLAADAIADLKHKLRGGAQVQDDSAALIATKKEFLVAHGYPVDYLEPIYDCKLCKDSGYVGQTPCTCLRQQVIDQLYDQSTIKEQLERENFDTFSLEYYSNQPDGIHKYTAYDNAASVLSKCKEFAEKFGEKSPGMMFYGETGLGKTFLTNCIAKALLDKGHTVLYLTAINLFENILADIVMGRSNDRDKLMVYDYIKNCELLIIDDLGTEVPNTFVCSQLFEIINMRGVKGLSTLISTNLGTKEFSARYTERIMSRIVENYNIYHLYGDNIRYYKRMEKILSPTT